MGRVYLPGEREFTGGFQAKSLMLKGVYLVELKMRPEEYDSNLYVYLDETDLASLDLVRQARKATNDTLAIARELERGTR